jgi:hypothetical protein
MLKVANGRSVQKVVAQPPLLGKSLSKVNDSRQRYKAYERHMRHMNKAYERLITQFLRLRTRSRLNKALCKAFHIRC